VIMTALLLALALVVQSPDSDTRALLGSLPALSAKPQQPLPP